MPGNIHTNKNRVSSERKNVRVYNIHISHSVIFLQIHDEAKKFSYQTGVKVVVAYGGTPIHQQVIIIHFFVYWFLACHWSLDFAT